LSLGYLKSGEQASHRVFRLNSFPHFRRNKFNPKGFNVLITQFGWRKEVNARTKIFIAEYDCARLISLMLWLEQFPEFEITGTAQFGTDLLKRIKESQPDVVLLDFNPETIDSLHIIRAIRTSATSAAILATSSAEVGVKECLNPSSSIKDLCESIRRVVNKKRVAVAAANVPMSKAC
jgi:DNA-binding NarL/FixJ family response regulator